MVGRATFICMLHYPHYLTELDRTVFIPSDPFRCRWTSFISLLHIPSVSLRCLQKYSIWTLGYPYYCSEIVRTCVWLFFVPSAFQRLPLVKLSVWSFYCPQYLSEVAKLLSVGYCIAWAFRTDLTRALFMLR